MTTTGTPEAGLPVLLHERPQVAGIGVATHIHDLEVMCA